MKPARVALGARIPRGLKERLGRICRKHGLKMSRLIQKALEETLNEIDEETRDLALARERLADADFISQEEYNRYLARRLRR